MKLLEQALVLLRCPRCSGSLRLADDGRCACEGGCGSRFETGEGYLALAEVDTGKYDPAYAARYAGLWAFGYQTLGGGQDEPLYRAVSSLAAESLTARPRGSDPPVVVDCGCGVGRVAADCAALAPAGLVLAVDGSRAMLELAVRLVAGEDDVEVDLAASGFSKLTVPARGCRRVSFVRADVERLPIRDGVADLALSVNVVDRLPHGPERALAECRRILRPGGRLVFTDPLNWTEPRLWRDYPDAERVLALAGRLGFEVETSFDDLSYRELLDARGSFEEFRTLVFQARK